jgi:Zn-dependent metalloprotease
VTTPATWMIGEDAFTPAIPGDALRYLDDPHRVDHAALGFPTRTADDDPDH